VGELCRCRYDRFERTPQEQLQLGTTVANLHVGVDIEASDFQPVYAIQSGFASGLEAGYLRSGSLEPRFRVLLHPTQVHLTLGVLARRRAHAAPSGEFHELVKPAVAVRASWAGVARASA
jgi:hypothetical protein